MNNKKNLTVKTRKMSEVIDNINIDNELLNFFTALYELKDRKVSLNDFTINLLKKLVNDYLIVGADINSDKKSAGYSIDGLSFKGFNLNNLIVFTTDFLKTIEVNGDKFKFFCKGMYYQLNYDGEDFFIKFTNMSQFIADINDKLKKENLTAINPLRLLTGVIKLNGEAVNLKTLKIIPKKSKK